jgi:uncharacterized repeat protein (TIGR01451 family)
VEITIWNRGRLPVGDLTVSQPVPAGFAVLEAGPKPEQSAERLTWTLGGLPAGEKRYVRCRLRLPLGDSPPARPVVSFRVSSGEPVPTPAAKAVGPELALAVGCPPDVTVGKPLTLRISVTNRGSVAVRGVALIALLSEGLQHPAGNELENVLGDFTPGQSRTLSLDVTPARAEHLAAVVRVTADGCVPIEQRYDLHSAGGNQLLLVACGQCEQSIELAAVNGKPVGRLALQANGPLLCTAGATVNYAITVFNEGDSASPPVRLSARLPAGVAFSRGNDNAVFDAATRTANWDVMPLPPGGKRSVLLSAVAEQSGEQRVTVGLSAGGKVVKQIPWSTKVAAVPATPVE